jgi:hypothetical protein
MSSAEKVPVETIWNQIAPIFSNRAFMRPHRMWFGGVSERTGHDRMKVLTQSAPARKLAPLVAGLDALQLGRLVVRSAINQDQAASALRLTLVANISVPVGALVLLNQFLPGSVEEMILDLPLLVVFGTLMTMILILIGVIWFAYAGVAAARDLNHLLRLHLADKTGGAGGADDEDGDALEVLLDLT